MDNVENSSDDRDVLVNLWKELRLIVDSVEVDLYKSANKNTSAGVRARHGLRMLKNKATELVKKTREHNQKNKKVRKSKEITETETVSS